MARELTIRIVGDSTSAERAFAAVGAAAAPLGERLRTAGQHMAQFGFHMSAVVTMPIVRFLGDATRAAIDDELAQSNLATALRNTVGATDEAIAGVEEFIDATVRSSTFTDDQLRPSLANLVRATGDVGRSQELLAVAMDIAAAKGLDLETVSQAMGRAALGNVGALGRLGVATRDASGETMSFDEVIAEAQRTMGDTSAIDTSAERALNFQNRIGELKEAIGRVLIPIMERLVPIVEKLVTWFENLSPRMQTLAVVALIAVAALGPLSTVIGGLITVIGAVLSPIGLVVVAIGALVAAVAIMVIKWQELTAWIRDNPMFAVLLAMLSPVILGLTLLAGAIRFVIDHFQLLRDGNFAEFFSQLWQSIATAVGEFVPIVLEQLAAFAAALWEWVSTTGVELLNKFVSEWVPAFTGWLITDAIPKTIEFLAQLWLAIATWAAEKAIEVGVLFVSQWVPAFVDWLVTQAIPKLVLLTAELGAKFIAWVGETGQTLLQKFMNEWVPAFVDWLVTKAIPTLVTETAKLGAAFVDWVTETAATLLNQFLNEWVPAFVDWLEDVAEKIPGKLTEIANLFWQWATSLPGKIGGWIAGAAGDLTSALGNLARNAWNAFARVWNGLSVPGFTIDLPGPIPDISFGGFALPDVPTLARGGVVTRPTLAVLGESGPEAVVPLDRMAGGNTYYVTINTTEAVDSNVVLKALRRADLLAGVA